MPSAQQGTAEACPPVVGGSGAETLQQQQQLAAARALCERANASFCARRDAEAVRLYTHALAGIPSLDSDPAAGETATGAPTLPLPAGPIATECLELRVCLLSNRSAALMRQDDWAGALADAELALVLSQPSAAAASASLATLKAKCQYCKALALLLLQRPGEALAVASEDAAMTELRRDAECMLAEQRDGRYDLVAMEAEAAAAYGSSSSSVVPLSRRRHADFESAGIRCTEVGGAKGRAMVACSELPAGSLIMASRAFVPPVKTQLLNQLRASRNGFSDSGNLASNQYLLPPSNYLLKLSESVLLADRSPVHPARHNLNITLKRAE